MSRIATGAAVVLFVLCVALGFWGYTLYRDNSALKLDNSRLESVVALQRDNAKRDANVLVGAEKARVEALRESQRLRDSIKELQNDKGFTDWATRPLPDGLLNAVRPE